MQEILYSFLKICAILKLILIIERSVFMRLLVFVLNAHEKLDALLNELEQSGIRGATILESTGMAKVLHHDEEEIPFLGSLRTFLNPSREKSNTILTVIRDEQLTVAVDAIERVVGDLRKANAGIVFSLPLDFVKGLSIDE